MYPYRSHCFHATNSNPSDSSDNPTIYPLSYMPNVVVSTLPVQALAIRTLLMPIHQGWYCIYVPAMPAAQTIATTMEEPPPYSPHVTSNKISALQKVKEIFEKYEPDKTQKTADDQRKIKEDVVRVVLHQLRKYCETPKQAEEIINYLEQNFFYDIRIYSSAAIQCLKYNNPELGLSIMNKAAANNLWFDSTAIRLHQRLISLSNIQT